jgi:superfamily I DNA/RNA helicase
LKVKANTKKKALDKNKNIVSCIEFQPKGALLIKGIPGSGKTTILLERARYLKEKKNEKKVVLLAYNRSLTSYLKQLTDKHGIGNVEVDTFHSWGLNILRSINFPRTYIIDTDEKYDKIRYAKNIINKQNKETINLPTFDKERNLVNFLIEEFEWMKSNNILSEIRYFDTQRLGRGTEARVTKKHKKWIYQIFEKYNELLASRRQIDFHDVAIILYEKINKVPEELLPNHILIDEAQDLTAMQLQVLSLYSQKSLTIGADKGQQIYKNRFSWKALGIDITGTRSRILDQTFRSTKEIIALANSFQQKDTNLVNDDEYVIPTLPQRSGTKPKVIYSNTYDEEMNKIINLVKNLKANDPEATIGIIYVKNERIEELATELDKKGIHSEVVNEVGADIISPGVKLTTYFSSKGLEFDHVIVANLRKKALPKERVNPNEDSEDILSTERKKFYVAITRAKLTLTISAIKPYSKFIDDLDGTLCEK